MLVNVEIIQILEVDTDKLFFVGRRGLLVPELIDLMEESYITIISLEISRFYAPCNRE